MTIKIREYDTVATGNKGYPVPLAVEPGKTRTLTSGVKAKLLKDTICALVEAAEGATWDCNTSALVDSSSGMTVPSIGQWINVKPGSDNWIEVTES